MQNKVDTLKTACDAFRQTRLGLENLSAQEAELKSALKTANAQLANLPLESVALPGKDDKSFDRSTSRLVSFQKDITIKLDLIPGIRVRYQAQAEGQAKQIRNLSEALIHHCRDLASARVDKERGEIAALLSPYLASRVDRVQAVAAKVMQGAEAWESTASTMPGCDAWRWRMVFGRYTHAHDALQDADAIIRLAEAFARGEPPR